MSLSTLPTEIFYRILDFVDFRDTFFGLRPTCRRIYKIIENYDRLRVNVTSLINGRKFRPLCRKIRPENVVSLFFEIDDVFDQLYFDELPRFLTNDSRIRSISIVDDETYVWIRSSLNLLQSMVNLPNLRQLSLDIDRLAIESIVWPEHSSVEKLKLRRCSFVTYQTISDRLTKLNDFRVLHDFANDILFEFPSTFNRSITSLTLYRLRMSIDNFHDFLSRNENLRSLDFSLQHFIDEPANEYFSRWENFLRSKLRNLKQFDVNFYGQIHVLTNVESVLQPLCSSFWLEEKKWFFTGKFIKTRFHKEIELSSWIPTRKTFPDTLEPVELCYSITTKRFADKTRPNSTWAARVDVCLMIENILQGKVNKSIESNRNSSTMLSSSFSVRRAGSILFSKYFSIGTRRFQNTELFTKRFSTHCRMDRFISNS